MKKLLNVIYLFILISCSKEEAAKPTDNNQNNKLANTKWEQTLWKLGTSTIPTEPGDRIEFAFINNTIVRITNVEPGKKSITDRTYILRNDTLFMMEGKLEHISKVESLTNTQLIINNFKGIDHATGEVFPAYGRNAFTFKKIE